MNMSSNAAPDAQNITPPSMSATRPLYWSLRRELWEHRSIYVALLAAAALGLLAFLFSLAHLPHRMRTVADPDDMPIMPYSHASMLLVATAVIVGVFYSLDALYGERRDRSILFWKSLPVSDRTTVLSKASIPLVVLPLLVFAIAIILQSVMLLLSIVVLLFTGGGVATLWQQLPLFQMQWVLLYFLVVLTLWHAPIYGWLMLVSGWARRTAVLWAVLPLLAIAAAEKIVFHTQYFFSLLLDRVVGVAALAFVIKTPDGAVIDPHLVPLTRLDPGRFFASSGLWIGLAFAVAFFAAAIRLRRYREPI